MKLGRIDGPDTTLQAGDVICFDQSARAIVIRRGNDQMHFDGDNKFGFAGDMTEHVFIHIVILLAETHGFKFTTIERTKGTSKDPFFTFKKA